MFNEDLSGGSGDATHCTTVLTEQTNTVCECATFGTVAVIIEHVQPPEVDEEFTWDAFISQRSAHFQITLQDGLTSSTTIIYDILHCHFVVT